MTDFFQYDFLTLALVGTLLLSLACGLISPLIISKRYAFMGAAVSHSTILGLAIALSLVPDTDSVNIFLITLGATLVMVLFLAGATFRQRLPSDSLIGIFFTGSMGLGVIIHSLFAQQKGDLMGYLFGNILLLDQGDLILSAILLLILIPIILFPLKRWLYIIYDEEGAIVSGLSVKFFHYLFFILLTLLIVSSLKIAGAILVNTLLLVPGVFGLRFGRNIKQVLFYSVSFSLVGSLLGLYLANLKNFPSGATLAVVQLGLLLLSLGLEKIKRPA
jgi:ABC-type Mn2+/Zn2+ transport system permease subunit